MQRAGFLILILLASSPALAQQVPDQCLATQVPGGGPAAADMIRQLRCTIAFVDSERMAAEDKATRFEVEAAMAKLDRDRTLVDLNDAKKDRDKALAEIKAAKDKEASDAAALSAHARKSLGKK